MQIRKPELWKPVNNFEARFEISNHGRLKSIGGKFGGVFILPCSIGDSGYVEATLRMKPLKRRVRIHTLVGEHFLIKPITDKKLIINHLDGVKINNYFENLEWATYKRNSEHAIAIGLFDKKGSKHQNSKLTEEDVLQIRYLYPKYTHKEIGAMFNICRRQAGDIINRVNWKHI